MKNLNPGQIVGNKLSTGYVLPVRVISYLPLIGCPCYRVTDARETRSDEWLIEHNRTWAAPVENLVELPGPVMHKNGLVVLGGE